MNNILALHDVCDDFELSITRIGVRRFERLIEYLLDRGCNITSLQDLRDENDIALTFDDGWETFYSNVFPILQKYDIGATVYIITGYIGEMSRWDYKRRKHLSWDQIKELAAYGVEIGNHGKSHIDLRKLSEAKLTEEIVDSKKHIEDKLGRGVRSFSYPFGRFDDSAVQCVKNAIYDNGVALSTDGGEFARGRRAIYMYDTPYTLNLKLVKDSKLERYKEYLNNRLAGGTITLRKLFPAGRRH